MKNLANIDCWIFDLDNTLYPASTDLFAQVCEKMSTYIANTLNVDKARADKMRYEYWQKYGTSLAGLMKNFKIDPDHFLQVVHNIDFSALSKDTKLLNALEELPGRKIVYTIFLPGNSSKAFSSFVSLLRAEKSILCTTCKK